MAGENKKIKTSAIAAFINTGTNSDPTWTRIRKQSELKLSYNGETQEDNWVDQDTPSTSLEKYSVSFDGEMTCFKDDPLFTYLDGLRQSRATGTAAETQCLLIYKYDGDASTGFKAEQNNCTIQFKDFGGEGGGGSASISYTCTFNDDPTLGTAKIADGAPTFNAATVSGKAAKA